jgi:hypothetical protein
VNAREIITSFDDGRLVTLDLGGRLGWRAKTIGALLGYAGQGRRLVAKIRSEWLSEFLHGHDYLKLDDDLVLLKPGLDLVLSRTNKQVGKRLRRHVVDEVLPMLSGGDGGVVTIESTNILVERERRLRGKLDLADRRFRSSTLQHVARVLRDLGKVTDDDFSRCLLAAAEIALGEPVLERSA